MNRYQPVLDYIERYWDMGSKPHGGFRNLVMHIGSISLPHPFIAPNKKYFAGTQFYWDTYFTILGLLDAGHHELAKGMVDNLIFLYGKFGLIPARNSYTSLGRTQPPFLTRMAWEVFEAGAADKQWLDTVLQTALSEYENVWMGGQRFDAVTGLSRYRPKYLSRFLTVYESGWDVSSRFANSKENILPLDLNCQLYQYESDLFSWAKLDNNKPSQTKWRKAMKLRKEQMDDCFWDQRTGFYYDNCAGRTDKLKTLAGFYPLWCGAATKEQAEKCVGKLKIFDNAGGLANTQKLREPQGQWDHPNGWAPQQLIVCEGLIRYGYKKEAERLATKWLDCNADVFERTGKLWEKYDVVRRDIGLRGRYPTQHGFAWTNSVFVRLHDMLGL